MKKLVVTGLAILTSALALGQQADARGHRPALRLHPLGVPVAQLGACPAIYKAKVVRIVLADPFDIKTLTRDVHATGFNGAGDDEDGQTGTAEPQPTFPTPGNTKLDLDLSTYLSGVAPVGQSKQKAVLIKIVVKDHDFSFREDGWAISSSNDDHMFCGLVLTRKTNGDEVARFYAVRLPKTQPYIGGFSIGLIYNATGPYSVPIFIDPKVENNG